MVRSCPAALKTGYDYVKSILVKQVEVSESILNDVKNDYYLVGT